MRVLMIAPTFLVVYHSVIFLIANRASSVNIKEIALAIASAPVHILVGRVLNACFNDCANILHHQQFCQILDR